MNKQLKPFLIIFAFWIALFFFVVAGYSGDLGFTSVTGYAIKENSATSTFGIQSLIIFVLFFTNILTMFFLLREKLK